MSNIKVVLDYFDEILPDAKCELIYHDAFSLVIAVLLSAQTTDKAVNKIMPLLFEKYKSPNDFVNANIEDIKLILKPLGMQNKKAQQIINLSKTLVENYDGTIKQDREMLESLPGVGRKTASVVLAEWFRVPSFAVDTHVKRLSTRFGLSNETASVLEVEKKLCSLIDEQRWIKTHHQFILFGRYTCLAKKPICTDCKLGKICNYDLC